jgi:peptidoglycan/LPS O-acetylase OafA/YrhL
VSPTLTRAGEWRVNNFDLIRLGAALQVLLVHADRMLINHGFIAGLFDRVLRLFPGVPIFFVVSGFLISRSYENSPRAADYYRNRCLRILPALWVCLVVSVGVVLAGGLERLGRATPLEWLTWWGAQMTLFQGHPAPFLLPPGTRLNGSLWTIPVELQFYLILPGLYALCGGSMRRGNPVLICLLLASLAFHLLALEGRPWIHLGARTSVLDTIVPYLWMFLTGVLVQRNWTRLRYLFVDRVHWWLAGYAVMCGLAVLLHRGIGSADISPLFLLPLGGLAISGAMSFRTLSDRLLHRNDVSYGLYIYHMPGVYLLARLAILPPPLGVALLVLVTLALAMLSWRLIERPFLAHKHRSLRAEAQGQARDCQHLLGAVR